MAFLDYGDVPISNDLTQNAIRPFVVGRKNWLFKGAESSAIVYSLVETAKANGIEPFDAGIVHAALPGQIPGSRGIGKADALVSGSQAPGAYTEINDGRVPKWDPAVIYFGRMIIERLRKGGFTGCRL